MRRHLYIALGLLMVAIFVYRALEAFQEPGLGLKELYVLGGFILSAFVIWTGLRLNKS